VAKRKRRPLRKKEGVRVRLGRLVNRVFITVTLGFVALYLIPLGTKVAQEKEERGEAAESAPPVQLPPVTVQVLNGCGEAGLALEATRFLREKNCDVVEMGNADHFNYKTSKIIARTGDLEAAERVRAALGVGEVSSDPNAKLLLQVTLILGSDCVPFPPEAATTGASGDAAEPDGRERR
jgi:hypothetical protein